VRVFAFEHHVLPMSTPKAAIEHLTRTSRRDTEVVVRVGDNLNQRMVTGCAREGWWARSGRRCEQRRRRRG
jgi:hypothetical protein